MTSAIDPTKPVSGNPTTESVRDNFAAAKTEIEALQGTNGTWTPVLDFTGHGNLAVTYALQSGFWTIANGRLTWECTIVTSTWTHSTATGNLVIKGLPHKSQNTPNRYGISNAEFGGFVGAGYQALVLLLSPNDDVLVPLLQGVGTSPANVGIANAPSGNTMVVIASGSYAL